MDYTGPTAINAGKVTAAAVYPLELRLLHRRERACSTSTRRTGVVIGTLAGSGLVTNSGKAVVALNIGNTDTASRLHHLLGRPHRGHRGQPGAHQDRHRQPDLHQQGKLHRRDHRRQRDPDPRRPGFALQFLHRASSPTATLLAGRHADHRQQHGQLRQPPGRHDLLGRANNGVNPTLGTPNSGTSATTVSLQGGTLNIIGSSTGALNESLGNVTQAAGTSTININPGSGGANVLTLANFTFSAGTLFVSGTGLGGTPGANVANLMVAPGAAPALTGTGLALVGAYATGFDGTRTGFLTYDVNGFRVARFSELASLPGAAHCPGPGGHHQRPDRRLSSRRTTSA